MRKIRKITKQLFTLTMVAFLGMATVPVNTYANTGEVIVDSASEVVYFLDVNLKKAINISLGKDEGTEITKEEFRNFVEQGNGFGAKTIIICQKDIVSIAGLEELKNTSIMSIDFSFNKITSGDSLKDVTTLKDINLSTNCLTKVFDITNLRNLEGLYLDDNEIQNLEGMGCSSALHTLSMIGNPLVSLEGIQNLPNVKELSFDDDLINDFSPLNALPTDGSVNINGNVWTGTYVKKNTGVDGEQGSTGDGTPTPDEGTNGGQGNQNPDTGVDGEQGKPESGQGNGNQDQNQGNNDKQDVIAFTDDNLKKSVNELLGRTDLQQDVTKTDLLNKDTVFFSGKQIGDITGLDAFVSVLDLDLSNNAIKDAKLLETMTSVGSINLANNKLQNVFDISKLSKLEMLNLENNGISSSDLRGIGSSTTLKNVNLAGNKFSSLQGIENLTILENLTFDEQYITDFDALNKSLSQLKNLKNVNGKKWTGTYENPNTGNSGNTGAGSNTGNGGSLGGVFIPVGGGSTPSTENKVEQKEETKLEENKKPEVENKKPAVESKKPVAKNNSSAKKSTTASKKQTPVISKADAEVVKKATVTAKATTLNLAGNKTTKVEVKVKTGYTVKYTTTSKNVTVDKKTGKVTAKKSGVATIKANIYKGNKLIGTKTVKITIKNTAKKKATK